ncbi:O-methylsterigmatocystin oxidoreductase [Coprinopsis cinerea okayama7|uniref:O-methylsterigmatocystin oxidoreductase n=1 Tax=Coprinopsis cinerea (strain Okayama-7 / 130 / ATCC MYA-4618 / FGSC 9003) TaxID=240176 RepID=A8NLT4_COPC7|nr:O-methylsterigmatocystin oxidoreductase [Coprinopsis cinerea okayama7\|eukprot:XP_001834771.2 O-methylsterigmatocystin oxidoreductase [Coprinopsis cinerea okayama7\
MTSFLASLLPLHVYGLLSLGGLVLLRRILRRGNQGRAWRNPNRLPYPPGPKPRPVIGNLLDLARDNESSAYYDLAQKYGQPLLFVNSFQTANDLFEKRSAYYSGRRRSIMINELRVLSLPRIFVLQDWDWSFGHMPYGERWKAHRKMFHQEFQQVAVPSYSATHEHQAKLLARRLLRSPQNLRDHLRLNAAGVTMGVVYGIEDKNESERFITVAEKALEGMAKAAKPGEYLVEFLPLLYSMRDAPFEMVLRALVGISVVVWTGQMLIFLKASGTAQPSFVSNLISKCENKSDRNSQLEIIRNCAGLAYAAGAESTISSLTTFILAMVLHPHVSARAQAELDEVVGHGRLPHQRDRASLPYMNAIVKEVLRWNPVAPLGLPHMLSKDDEYNGYFIPAGTLVIGNTWTILHDPEIFPDPMSFNPDRFMQTSSNDDQQFASCHPLSSAFGYGRRVCPGRFMAEQQLFITMATILNLFDISPGLDENGRPIPVEPKFSSGMISHPLPFAYTIKPRGEYVHELLA